MKLTCKEKVFMEGMDLGTKDSAGPVIGGHFIHTILKPLRLSSLSKMEELIQGKAAHAYDISTCESDTGGLP